ncbi:hypothetical protein F8M41_017802 [Gigaspora margarita]|uniref:Uncharacterized protein n=1 Tax=Gigaspora margarita TaxID=4874 RepID=A0A8H4ELU8_GIGMA|nr:hypothetical protein F8M41_017802 [Gigaspora margarita]
MTTSSTSSNTTTQSQECYEAVENKIIELQEKFNEQEKLNEQSSLINSNIVPLVLRPIQDNIEGFSISKIPLAKIFKLDNKAIREVKKTFGLFLDNHNIPKNYTISKIDPLHSQYKEYVGDNIWAYEESMKQVMQDRDKVNIIDTDTDDNDIDDQRNYEESYHILNNDKAKTINMDTDENDSDYKKNRHILNNVPKSKNLNPNKDTFPILKERKVNKIVASKLGDISNESASEYYDNDRPSKRTRSQRKK